MPSKSTNNYLICLAILIIILFATLKYTGSNQPLMHSDQNALSSSKLQINLLLHDLRVQCVTGKYDQAINTVLDIKEQWPYPDTEAKEHESYFPSDSLQHLDSLLNQLAVKQKDKQLVAAILLEIKSVNHKLDRMPDKQE